MLILRQITGHQLAALIDKPTGSAVDHFLLPTNEEVAPSFVLERMLGRANQDPHNSFWWLPWLVIVDQLVVGMCGFKSPPDNEGSVEIGYGMVPSQQKRGFATQAVNLLVKEGFAKSEIQQIVAHTIPSNTSSHRVLEKNDFVNIGSTIDLEDDLVWIWRKMR